MERFQEYYTMKDLSKIHTREDMVEDVKINILEDYNRRFGTAYKEALLALRARQEDVRILIKKLDDMEYSPPDVDKNQKM